MRPGPIHLHPKTYQRLVGLRREAERYGAYRVAKRLRAVLLNADRRSSVRIEEILQAPRSKVPEWLANYDRHGEEGLLMGQCWEHRHVCRERSVLGDIIESGPKAYGLDSGVWTSPMIGRAVEAEVGVVFHPGHVRKLLAAIGFSVQCPRRRLARADDTAQARWRRRPLPPLIKSQTEERGLLLTEEASFQQDSTLHPTWWRIGCRPQVPVPGQ